jgi:hypothetical protein
MFCIRTFAGYMHTSLSIIVINVDMYWYRKSQALEQDFSQNIKKGVSGYHFHPNYLTIQLYYHSSFCHRRATSTPPNSAGGV